MNELEIFGEAIEIADEKRRANFLQEACGPDVKLKQKVEKLLAAIREDSFLEHGANFSNEEKLSSPANTVPHVSDDKVGGTIGPYKILQLLGEGGMGKVFLAEQKTPVKRRVALKLIRQGMNSEAIVARFEAERQAISMMDHPNIARALDAGTTSNGNPYLVMELVKGVPITEFCDERKLSTRERLCLFVPVCQAIHHAHQKGIVHRDLKPSNILVTEYDSKSVPKVVDFGVAKALHQPLTEKTLFTQIGQIIGTLEYMSPEQAKVNELDIDTRSDIYSLGVVLYELITGTTPHDSKQLRNAAWDEMVRIIRLEDPQTPSKRVSSSQNLPVVAENRHTSPAKLSSYVQGDLDWIVMKALEKNRDRRYETANGLAKDVQRYLEGEPVAACPPSFVYRFKKFSRKYRGVLVSVTSVLAALGLATVFSTVFAIKANHAQREANQNLKELHRSNAELVETRGNEALENALDQLLRGNVEESRKSLEVARTHGADEGKIALFSSTLNFYEGNLDYRDELENASNHLTNSMAAKILLANTYRFGPLANLEKFPELDRQIEELTPKTTIDLLLAGQHFALQEPDRAIEYLEELRKTHNSRLAFYELSRVYTTKVMEAYDNPNVEGFLKYADVAFQTMPSNELAGRRYVFAHLAAADHFRSGGRMELEEYHVGKAMLAAKSLEDEHPRASLSHQTLVAVHAYKEEWDEAITHALEANKYLDKSEGYANSVALMIRQGRTPNVDNCAQHLVFGELLQVLAVLHSTGAQAARESMQEWEAKNDRPLMPFEIALSFEIKCLLGEPETAVHFADRSTDEAPPSLAFREFVRQHLNNLAGRLNEEEVLPHLKHRAVRQWHYAAQGFKRLGEGKRGEAIRAFEEVEKEGKFVFAFSQPGFTSRALAYLHRLREDPTWPAWIPVNDSE